MLTFRLPVDDDAALDDDRSNIFSIQRRSVSLTNLRYPPDDPVMSRHIEAACRYGVIIDRIAVCYGLLPSVIAGLGSRQSGWGLDLSPIGPTGSRDFAPRLHRTAERQSALPDDGDGFARGLMQLDYDRHDIARGLNWRDPEKNIDAACRIISDHRSYLRRQTILQGFGLLRASLAAFDCGIERVQYALRQGLDVDSPTSGRNYGRDILERAGFFQAHGWD